MAWTKDQTAHSVQVDLEFVTSSSGCDSIKGQNHLTSVEILSLEIYFHLLTESVNLCKTNTLQGILESLTAILGDGIC